MKYLETREVKAIYVKGQSGYSKMKGKRMLENSTNLDQMVWRVNILSPLRRIRRYILVLLVSHQKKMSFVYLRVLFFKENS